MSENVVKDRARIGGSGHTIFHWQGKVIAFARQVAQTSPEPVAAPVAIQALDHARPDQIITPQAAGMGTITLDLIELFGAPVWERLTDYLPGSEGIEKPNDIVDIFRAVASSPNYISMTKIISPPYIRDSSTTTNQKIPFYTETYHRCVITNVANSETINVGSMEILKQVTIAYTKVTIERSPTGLLVAP